MKTEGEKIIQKKTIGDNITVRDMPAFDENGKLIVESIPVTSTEVEHRTFTVTVVSANPPYDNRDVVVDISTLMREDAAEIREDNAAHSQPI